MHRNKRLNTCLIAYHQQHLKELKAQFCQKKEKSKRTNGNTNERKINGMIGLALVAQNSRNLDNCRAHKRFGG
jgi:hypothetical protein